MKKYLISFIVGVLLASIIVLLSMQLDIILAGILYKAIAITLAIGIVLELFAKKYFKNIFSFSIMGFWMITVIFSSMAEKYNFDYYFSTIQNTIYIKEKKISIPINRDGSNFSKEQIKKLVKMIKSHDDKIFNNPKTRFK